MTPLDNRKFNQKLEKHGFERKPKKINGDPVKSWFGFSLVSEIKKQQNQGGQGTL